MRLVPRKIGSAWPLLLLLLFTALLLWRVLPPASGRVLGNPDTDITNQFLCPYHFAGQSLRAGSLPLWNPHILCGTPFLAGLQTGLLYPLAMPFYLLFPAAAAANLVVALHIFLAGLFMYRFLRGHELARAAALTGALTYAFAATTVLRVHAGHLSIIAALPWAPFVFRRLELLQVRSSAANVVMLAAGLALMFLAGQPQLVYYTALAMTAYQCWMLWRDRRELPLPKPRAAVVKLLLFAVAGVLALLLGAAQFLPTHEMLRFSTRQALAQGWTASYALPPENLATLLVPGFFGSSAGTVPYWGKNLLWEACVYLGVLPLLLAALAWRGGTTARRRCWFWCGLAAGVLLLSLGNLTPLFRVCQLLLPGFSMFRGVGKVMFLFTFAIGVLAAYGTDNLQRGVCGVRTRSFLLATAALLALVLATAGLLSARLGPDWFSGRIRAVLASPDFHMEPIADKLREPEFARSAAARFRSSGRRSLLYFGFGAGAILLLGALERRPASCRWRAAAALLLPAVVAADLVGFGLRYTGTFACDELLWDREVLAHLQRETQPFRLAAPQFRLNTNMLAGIDSPEGAETMLLRDYNRYYNHSQLLPPDEPSHYVRVLRLNRLTDLMNLKYLLVKTGTPLGVPGLELVLAGPRQALYRNLNALPRAFVVENFEVRQDFGTTMERLADEDFDPAASVVLDTEPGLPLAAANASQPAAAAPGQAVFVTVTPERQVLKVEMVRPGILVLSQNHYPGWQVWVNGAGGKLLRANGWMQAIALPAGSHEVELSYSSRPFIAGSWISFLALLSALATLLAGAVARRVATLPGHSNYSKPQPRQD